MDNNKLVDFAVEARKYKTLITKKFENRKHWIKPNDGDLLSLLPGTVKTVNVKIGDKVKTGDLLLIQEAMKMQNRIIAHKDGVITNINVKEGDKIGKHHLILNIENQ